MGEEEDISQTIPLIYGQFLPLNFTKRKISHVNGAHQKVSKIKDYLRHTLPIIYLKWIYTCHYSSYYTSSVVYSEYALSFNKQIAGILF